MKKSIRSFIITILITGIVIFLVSTFLYQLTFIAGDSMSPTYHNHQAVIAQKWGISSHLKPNDVIVIRIPSIKQAIVKRIVGCPGDTVQIKNGQIYVNDILWKDSIPLPADNQIINDAGNAKEPITLSDDEYFVLGDNRNASIDSRFDEIGIIQKSQITGIVLN